MTGNDLYRYYDADGELLYVGISVRPFERARAHAANSVWWDDVACFEREQLRCSRTLVHAIERLDIIARCPKYNVIHRAGDLSETAALDEAGRALRYLVAVLSSSDVLGLSTVVKVLAEDVALLLDLGLELRFERHRF